MKRREFLESTAYCGLALAFGGPLVSLRAHAAETLPPRAWEDLYRDELAATLGDAMGYAFHCSNCQGNCAWKVYAKDGMVTREEQAAAYPPVSPTIPDANPRGCNKGIVHSKQMVQADRLLYPLRRVGRRGEGKWERVAWDAAIDDIAARVVDSLQGHGLASLMVYCGTGILSQGRRAGPLRLGSLLGAQRLYPASAVGDMFTGASLAYGLATVGHTLDAWFEAKTILLWGINAAVTRIPDAHYLMEARYKGSQVYCITPEYNATAKLSSHWVPVKAGTDSFLALSLLHLLFRDGRIDRNFVREQTDLPFLVRTDTGDLLRHRDLRDQGKDDVFFTVPPKGLKPVGETKSEWEICLLLAQAIAKEAQRRGIAAIPDPDFLETKDDKAAPVMRDLVNLPEDFTDQGKLTNDEDVVRRLMEQVPAIAPWTPEDAMRHGYVTLNRQAGFTSPLYANRPFYSFEHNVYLRQPYATLSGRQQFYVDHPLFKRLACMTPTAMAPVRPKGFPLAFWTPHTRHGIHSQWRANAQLLRLQRGEPYVWLNPDTARGRGIGEGDPVRVYNDVGEFQARAKLMPAVPPDALVMDHAWEPFQFRNRLGLNNVVAGLLSPLELATGWGHLSFNPNWDGNMLAFESAVEVEQCSEATA